MKAISHRTRGYIEECQHAEASAIILKHYSFGEIKRLYGV
jgi:hypothetical protein